MLEALRPESFKPTDYIMHRADGRALRPDTLTRQFEKQVARLGMPPMRFHDLRHSTASILFDRGWSLEDVKQWLRHSDIETTSNIYLHYRRERKVMLAGNLAGVPAHVSFFREMNLRKTIDSTHLNEKYNRAVVEPHKQGVERTNGRTAKR